MYGERVRGSRGWSRYVLAVSEPCGCQGVAARSDANVVQRAWWRCYVCARSEEAVEWPAGGCAISQAGVLNGAIKSTSVLESGLHDAADFQIKSARAVVAMSSLSRQARTAPPRKQTRMSAWTGSRAIGEICLAQRRRIRTARARGCASGCSGSGWTRLRDWPSLQLSALVTPHSPANHANSAAWCS